METLRQTIKTLFELQKSDNVIASLLKGKCHDDAHVNRRWFVRAYLDDISPIRTKDQVEAIFDLLESKWALNENDIKSLAFCPTKSVFNVLLHFSSCVLKEYKHQPVCRYDDLLRWHDLTSNLGEDLFTTSYLAAKDVMQKVDRRFFNWKDIISHDNAALNNIFEKRMIDLHYHLYGSIFVFDLNWLSLMNDVTDRQDSFRKIFDYLRAPHIINSSEVSNSLYNKVMKAASIRLLLFCYLKYYVPTSAYNSKDKELGFTFHVGEDFLDIVDGLRAVRESILFLNLENRDRLGHALVLGTDVEKYYRKRGYYISMSKQTLLDNIVWLYFEGSCCDGFNRIAVKLKALYSKYFDDIYGKCKIMDGDHVLTPNIEDYYNAWLLRGDNPECYKNPQKEYENRLTSYWGIYALNESEAVSKARKNIKARFLYYFYHYDEYVYKEGCKCDQIKLDEDYIYVIRQLQAKLLDEVEMKHISIETNPTSNYRIGDFERYDEHPILYFFNYGLEHEDIAPHSITVSINTDDKGVFSTSLEREFSVMAAALEKKSLVEKDGNSPRRIYDWLDRIREMGFEMRFDR